MNQPTTREGAAGKTPVTSAGEAVERVECAECGGGGQRITGEYFVTQDMAIDACDRSLEGMHHSYAYDVCLACEGTGLATQPESTPPPTDKGAPITNP